MTSKKRATFSTQHCYTPASSSAGVYTTYATDTHPGGASVGLLAGHIPVRLVELSCETVVLARVLLGLLLHNVYSSGEQSNGKGIEASVLTIVADFLLARGELLLELLNLLGLVLGRKLSLGGLGSLWIPQFASQYSFIGWNKYLLLKLRVLLLRVDEVEEDVERTRKDEGEEEREAGQVRVPLRAGNVPVRSCVDLPFKKLTRIYARRSSSRSGRLEHRSRSSSRGPLLRLL